MKRGFKAIGVMAAAAAIIATTAPHASAADVCPSCYGGVISNLSGVGTFPIWISNGVSWMKLTNAHISLEYSNYRDVDAFKVEIDCTATSQWGYVYKPYANSARVYYDSTSDNSMDLKLKYRCYA